jgi:hypothetical protein
MATMISDRFSLGAFYCAHTRVAAVVRAVAATLGIWAISTFIGRVDLSVDGRAVGPISIVVATLLAGLAGWGLLALVERRTARAWPIWRAIAIVVLVLSMLGPLGADTGAGKTTLSVMHAFAGAILITGFAPRTRRD